MSELASSIRYVLDTDMVTHQQMGHPSVITKLQEIDRATVATTVITMYEQLRGRMAAVNRKQSNPQLQNSLRLLQATQRYYCTATILAFDDNAVLAYQRLLEHKLRIGAQDLQIAAITLSRHAMLVTANRRHFEQVPGLTTEDWTRL